MEYKLTVNKDADISAVGNALRIAGFILEQKDAEQWAREIFSAIGSPYEQTSRTAEEFGETFRLGLAVKRTMEGSRGR